MTQITYRNATPEDCALVMQFIYELAEYENLTHEVVVTETDIRTSMFGKTASMFCMIAEASGKPAGFALCFLQGCFGIYLADLFVREEYRGRGIGKGFFNVLAKKAKDEGYKRLQWVVLDWNTSSIEFYERLGAEAKKDWITMQLDAEGIDQLAGSDERNAA